MKECFFCSACPGRGGGGNLHMSWIRGCAIILGTFLGVAPGFLGISFGYSRIFGYHFLVKFDFFKNNPDIVVLILIFPSMTLPAGLLFLISFVEMSNDSAVLVSVLLCLCKEFHIVYNCY